MKKIVPMVMSLLMLLFMFVATAYAFFDKTTMSKSENRELQAMPELTAKDWVEGNYQDKLDGFFSDHVLNRSKFISFAGYVEDKLRLPGKKLILKDVEVENKGNNKTEFVFLDDRIVPLYYHNDESLLYFFNSNNALFGCIPDNINKYYCIFPGRIEFEEESVRKLSDSGEEDAKIIYDNTSDNVTTINTYDAVRKGVEENGLNSLYFRTDHHWTALGAYYAANEFAKAAKKQEINIADYNKIKGFDFEGFLSVKHNKMGLLKPDVLYCYTRKTTPICNEIVRYKNEDTGELEIRNEKVIDTYRYGYYTFVERSSFAYAEIKGTGEDGCLLVLGDSYSLAFSTWLTHLYKTIVIVDPRYFDVSDRSLQQLLVDYEVTDFVVGIEQSQMSVDIFNKIIVDVIIDK